MTPDLTIIGIVFALILVLIFFSAIVLYLAFRIKETFRKETRKGFTIVKIGFLIGILFLAGGIFYFFANNLGNIVGPSPTPSGPYLTLSVSYPQTVTFNTLFTIDFTVINPTNAIAHGATIQANILFADFLIQSSTHEVVGNVIKIGDVPSGTTIISLQVLSPSKPGTVVDTASLLFQERSAPVTQQITISIEGGPNSTPTPSPTQPSVSPSPTPPPVSEPVLTLSVSYPSSTTLNSTITMSFTIRNLATVTAHGATIETQTLFENFAVLSSTREIDGNVVNVGDIPPGTTIISLQLLSPSKPGTVVDTVSLLFQEMTEPVTQQITISIRGGP
jgi:hypothetical protein